MIVNALVWISAGVEQQLNNCELVVFSLRARSKRANGHDEQRSFSSEIAMVHLVGIRLLVQIRERAEFGDKVLYVGQNRGMTCLKEVVYGFDGGARRRGAGAAPAACGIVGEWHRSCVAARGFAESRRGEKSEGGCMLQSSGDGTTHSRTKKGGTDVVSKVRLCNNSDYVGGPHGARVGHSSYEAAPPSLGGV